MSNPKKNLYILEVPDDCGLCESDRTLGKNDITRAGINPARLIDGLSSALRFRPLRAKEEAQAAPFLELGAVLNDTVTWQIVLLFPFKCSPLLLDAAILATGPKIVLHMDCDAEVASYLHTRHCILVHLPTAVAPRNDGTFEAPRTLLEILAAHSPARAQARPKSRVTFSNQFKTVYCEQWKAAETRTRARQATNIIRALYENWTKGNSPASLDALLPGVRIERLDKSLDSESYPEMWGLIRQRVDERTGERMAWLSDDYFYEAR
ncbi:MAG TPA: hypothetical protein PKE12_09870 [Kiritimatiellia bacterium]|nr:hypothetical protein [Kiritimatiellia bacterium]